MLTSIVLTLAVSMLWMTADLLVPIRLDGNGFSAAGIGLALSTGLGDVHRDERAHGAARRPLRDGSPRRRLDARDGPWHRGRCSQRVDRGDARLPGDRGRVVGGLDRPYLPARATGARRGHFSVAVVGALLNMVWAGSGLIGPTAGGAVSQAFGDQVAFWLLAAIAVASATWMWLRRGRGDRSNRARASRSRS